MAVTGEQIAWPREPGRLPHHVLNELAKRQVDGTAFLANTRAGWVMAFGALLASMHTMPDHFMDNVGAVWEMMDNEIARTVDGVPVFPSCRFIHKADLPLLNRLLEDAYSAVQEEQSSEREQ